MFRFGIAAAIARRVCIFALFAGVILLLLPTTTAATTDSSVHGNVYDWATFNTMNNAVVEVYSMPGEAFIERTVVKSGSYRFELPAGTYLISARAGTPGTQSELLVTENVTIADSGDYTIDLILFPPTGLEDLEAMNDSELNSTLPGQVTGPSPTPVPGSPDYLAYLGIGIIIVAMILGIGFLVYIRRSGRNKNASADAIPEISEGPSAEGDARQATGEMKGMSEPHEEIPARPGQYLPAQDPLLPQDCRDVMTIMEKNGGRITQLELRKMLPYSEAKVSLIVSDLESRGIIKKIKKGRGNILILNKPGEQQ